MPSLKIVRHEENSSPKVTYRADNDNRSIDQRLLYITNCLVTRI